ncbi:unnamed protein product [Paramecium sonneborni]|uniref:Uncharacterized protein n=1 Tax=Paramecium sonneborni TaxID=65129 RepID=A0A8S1M897_9CILI|nr:unnamed protein product [Paramecium sonneborni]
MLKKIWEKLSESMKQLYDWIEQEYFNIINLGTNLAESSYANLEKFSLYCYWNKIKRFKW